MKHAKHVKHALYEPRQASKVRKTRHLVDSKLVRWHVTLRIPRVESHGYTRPGFEAQRQSKDLFTIFVWREQFSK